MTRLIVLLLLIISAPAFASFEETVREGERYFKSDEYRQAKAAKAEAERLRNAPVRNRQLIRAAQTMASRFHRGLASGVATTWDQTGLYVIRVDLQTNDRNKCKGKHANVQMTVFECVNVDTYEQKTEYFTDDYLFGSRSKSVRRKQ